MTLGEMLPDWRLIADASAKEAQRLEAALASPRDAQFKLLDAIMKANASCEFGRRHNFSNMRSLEDFRARVPIANYESFAADIDRTAQTGISTLFNEAPVAFERTGGSSAGSKLVPYNTAMLSAFQCGVLPWMHGMLQRHSAVTEGPFYATISPATRQIEQTPCGSPIGLASDAVYLGEELVAPFLGLLAVPPGLGAIADVEQWRAATLAALVEAQNLAFISLWSPTFLLSLLESAPRLGDAIASLLSAEARVRFVAATADGKPDTTLLWPKIACISCWTDGPSAAFARALAGAFPHAAIDPKGVLATEAPITLSWGANARRVPALTSCLIEFISGTGDALLCDELKEGDTYRAVITTPGGLYRYDIGDLFECRGTQDNIPDLHYVGRAGVTSDLVGEKLEDGFVSAILSGLAVPAMLAPREDRSGYELLVESTPDTGLLLAQVERGLCANPQYEYARRMGQLAPLCVRYINDLSSNLIERGLAAERHMGDVKSQGLLPNPFEDQVNR